MSNEGDLKIWWKPQIPMKASFEVPVENVLQARLILNALAEYDLFQLKQHIKPDFCNVGGLLVYEDGEWVEWYDENGDDIYSSEILGERIESYKLYNELKIGEK